MAKRDIAIALLRDKAASAEGRALPRKQDFTGEEVCLIKQALGPWPRALEAAGLKEDSHVDRKALNREKRRRVRRRYRRAVAQQAADAVTGEERREKEA